MLMLSALTLRSQRHHLGQSATFRFLLSLYLGIGSNRVKRAKRGDRKTYGVEKTFHPSSDPDKLDDVVRSLPLPPYIPPLIPPPLVRPSGFHLSSHLASSLLLTSSPCSSLSAQEAAC